MTQYVVSSARSVWANVTGDRITPAKHNIASWSALLNRARFPLSMDHPDTQVAVEFISRYGNFDALMNSIFGPLCGANSDSTFGYIPWIILADSDEKFQEQLLSLLGPESPIGKILLELSYPTPKFFQKLRENWGNEYAAVLAQSETKTDGSSPSTNNTNANANDNNKNDNNPTSSGEEEDFVTHPIPLSMTCYFSTRIMQEQTNANLRTKSRLDVPATMILPNWFPPTITNKFTASSGDASSVAGSAGGSSSSGGGVVVGAGADLTVTAMRVTCLSHLIFRMIRCLVMFGQCREKPSWLHNLMSSGKLKRFGKQIAQNMPQAVTSNPAVNTFVNLLGSHLFSNSATSSLIKEHRFPTLEKLLLNWTQFLLCSSISRVLLNRERILDLLVTGKNSADDTRLLSLCDATGTHAAVVTLLLPTMTHIYGHPVYGEASRNPISDQRHLNLIESSMPLLAQFLDRHSHALDVVTGFASSNTSTSDANTNNSSNTRNINTGGSSNVFSMKPPTPPHPSEKVPRLNVHDFVIPVRHALRTVAGITRQSMITLFIHRREVEISEKSMFETATSLWLSMVRCSRSLARAIEPHNIGLRQYESACSLLGDFLELCYRTENEWECIPLLAVENICEVFEILLEQTTISNSQQQGSSNFSPSSNLPSQHVSPLNNRNSTTNINNSNRRPAAFTKECSNILQSLQAHGGATNSSSSSTSTSKLAFSEALDASLNVNALFDFQGEGTASEAVPSWKCYLAILSPQVRPKMGKLYQLLTRGYSSSDKNNNNKNIHDDDISEQVFAMAYCPLFNNSNQQQQQNQQQETHEQQIQRIKQRISSTMNRTRDVFVDLFGEDITSPQAIFGTQQQQENANDDNNLSPTPGAGRRGVFGDSKESKDKMITKTTRGKGSLTVGTGTSSSLSFDPRIAVLSKIGKRRILRSVPQAQTIDAVRDSCDLTSSSTCNNIKSHSQLTATASYNSNNNNNNTSNNTNSEISTSIATAQTSFTGMIRNIFQHDASNFSNRYVPTNDEIHFLAKWLHVGDAMISSWLNSLRRYWNRSVPRCSHCQNYLQISTEVECCEVHPSEIAVWHCSCCCFNYCSSCRIPPTTAEGLTVLPARGFTPETTVCEKCHVTLQPDDVQYWVELSKTIRCPRCVVPQIRVSFLRLLASNYFLSAVLIYYVLNFLYWLFLADDYEFVPEYSPRMVFVEDFQ